MGRSLEAFHPSLSPSFPSCRSTLPVKAELFKNGYQCSTGELEAVSKIHGLDFSPEARGDMEILLSVLPFDYGDEATGLLFSQCTVSRALSLSHSIFLIEACILKPNVTAPRKLEAKRLVPESGAFSECPGQLPMCIRISHPLPLYLTIAAFQTIQAENYFPPAARSSEQVYTNDTVGASSLHTYLGKNNDTIDI
ncbi:hypothetical protein WG66_014219 [Moniliophthora roreri]|nr:hypothetical protein WG66_014219 [Moniliophthora roreri]